MSDAMMILIMFGLLVLVPIIVVGTISFIIQHKRNRKKNTYLGITEGRVDDIKRKGLDHPHVMTVTYVIDGIEYRIKETIKLKSETIKIGCVPVGQRKTYRMGNVSVGDHVTVQYDLQDPAKALIADNDGVINI